MKIFITHRSLSYFSVNRIQIKMLPHRFIYGIINPVFNLYFRFELFIRKLDNSLCISRIIRLNRISMIDTHKTCYYILDRTRTSFRKQICKQRDLLENGADLIDRRENSNKKIRQKYFLFDVYFGKLFNYNIFIMFQYPGSYKKNVEIRHVHVLCFSN